jgi:osmotically-inducible protein OsmY
MLKTQTTQTKVDGFTGCREQPGLSLDEQGIYGTAGEKFGLTGDGIDPVKIRPIHLGQKVFSQDDQFMGLVTKLISNEEGLNSHFVVRTRRLLGRQKITSVECVSSVEPKGIILSIPRTIFLGFPDYKSDAAIAVEIDHAFWDDWMLRSTDYREIGVRVKGGAVSITGYVISTQNKRLVENALQKIQGILSLKIHLIADDVLVLKVAAALGQMEHAYRTKFFTSVNHGVVALFGEVDTPDIRCKAEQCAAGIPWVRGVINKVRAPGINLETEDQRFLQPAVGQEIYFGEGPTGTVKQVIINPNNRRVTAMIVQRRCTDPQPEVGSGAGSREQYPKRPSVIPVSAIHYLTQNAGFLRKSDPETVQVYDFDPAHFVIPRMDWVPPYPYCSEDVLFPVEMMRLIEDEVRSAVPPARVGTNAVLLKG